MDYLIHTTEPAGEEARRVLREQCRRTLDLLADWKADPAGRIHRARQTCKKLRALARVIKLAAPYPAHVENRFFRDLQKRLAYARDAEAMVEALNYLEIGVTEPRLQESVAMLRESLAARARRGLEDNLPALDAQVRLACADLAIADERLARIPLHELRRRDLRRGAEHTWARCARDFAALEEESPAEAFHHWRRHVKYAWYQTQLLAELMPARSMALGPRLRELASLLGHAQDLDMLDNLLRQQADALQIDTHVQRLRALIADSLRQLRHRALAVGRELFAGDMEQADGPDPVPPVTNEKQSRKAAATSAPHAPGSRVRRPRSHREPNPTSRWQPQ